MQLSEHIFILLLLLRTASCLTQQFSVHEGMPPGSVIGFINDQSMPTTEKTKYYFKPNDNLFRFDDNRPSLIVTNVELDREELCPYQETCSKTYEIFRNSSDNKLKIVPLTRITIDIIDVNDHSPQFPASTRSPHVVEIVESALRGKQVRLPSAHDMDAGLNGNISYSFSSKSSPAGIRLFSLKKIEMHGSTNYLMLELVGELDREKEKEYHFTIIAADNGTPSESTNLDLVVKVKDVNDNTPKFDRESYEMEVEENAPVGQEVLMLRATDSDEGKNAQLTFAWTEETKRYFGNYFTLDTQNGSIRVASTLDHETQKTLTLTAVVSDMGDNPFSSYATIVIHVKDVNERAPSIVFMSQNGEIADHFEVDENLPKGTLVGHVVVTDDDEKHENQKLTCSLHSSNFFLLSPSRTNHLGSSTTFELMTGSVFDRENTAEYSVTVTCQDSGVPPLHSSEVVKVYILDRNDNMPVFERNVFRVEVEENTSPGTTIVQIKAKDADDGRNSELTYQLQPEQPNWRNMLSIDQHGNVVLMVSLDCEVTSQMLFKVRATDGGVQSRTGETRLEVTVKDRDEHQPKFEKAFYEFTVHSILREHSFIGQVKATDRDCSTRFGSVVYKLMDSGDVNHVYVDKQSGEIRSRSVFDKNLNFTFQVLPGNPSERWFPESIVNVSVQIILPEVTKPLQLLQLQFEFPKDENQSVPLLIGSDNGTLVCQIKLTNQSLERAQKLFPRSEPQSILRFKISSGNEENLLTIDETTGWIKTNKAYKHVGNFRINVTAYNVFNPNENVTSVLNIPVNKPEAVSFDPSTTGPISIFEHSVLIAILLACSAFLIIFCVTVFVIRCHFYKRKRRPRRYNCRLETVKAASNSSLTRGSYMTPELNGVSTLKSANEQNIENMNSLQRFNNKFVSFSVDDDVSCHMTDSKSSCPFRENCVLHKMYDPNEFDELTYLNERVNDFYNLPVFSTSLYSTQKSLPNESHFKSFKPLRTSPFDKPPSPITPGTRQISPASFFPITCSGHFNNSSSCQSSLQNDFNFITSAKAVNGRDSHDRSLSSLSSHRRHSESQI